MGLISRVSSRTYRSKLIKKKLPKMRVSAIRRFVPWGHNMKPYYLEGHVQQELTYSNAKMWVGMSQRMRERWRITKRQMVQKGPEVIFCYAFYKVVKNADYEYHRK